MMKKVIVLGAVFIFMACGFTSCEALNSCKICKQVTYESGSVVFEDEEGEYCDADLAAIETADDYVSGNTRIAWECR